MPPVLEQTAYATVAKYQSRTCKATFDRPTKPGSLIVIVDAAAGTLPSDLTKPSGFTTLAELGLRDMQMSVWYRNAAPSMTSVSITALDDNKSQQIRMFEYSGMSQSSNILDRITVRQAESRDPYTGTTDLTQQNDELVLAFVANQYASTAQYGFRGNLSRLYESVSPQRYWDRYNSDWERSRLSVHQSIATSEQRFSLDCDLSTTRRWMTVLVTFRGGSVGPARFTSVQQQTPVLTTRGRGDLSAFGPMTSGKNPDAPVPPMIKTGGQQARIGPFNYQYRLGGWSGLLIGSGTQFHVEGTDGLGGWQMRTSDEDRPRGDGSLRGIDLESARQIVFKMNVGKGRDEVERNMDLLYRALIPQRDTDWELIWRHPIGPMKMMRVRPIELNRARNKGQLTFGSQSFALRASDPRHYNAVPTTVTVPVTPANADPQRTQVTNIGNSPAYPIITIKGPSFGSDVSRIQLVNETALVNFEAELTLSKGSTFVADMDARITGVPRSIITLDGQTKYGAWQLPREPFRIDPDPTGFGSFNEVYLITDPPGAPVVCTLEYRDTWAG
jgi:hypothetical protein